MAFCDLKPVRVYDEKSGSTYYIGDTFSAFAFGADKPDIYSWDQTEEIIEDKTGITFKMNGGEYFLLKKYFAFSEDYFRAIAIIETACRDYGFAYTHGRRILPVKTAYTEVSPGKEAYIGEGMIDENEAAATFVMLMNFKLVKVLWLIAVLITLVLFLVLHLIIGVNRGNLLYFIPISVIGGGIITLVVYLICYGHAKRKYTAIAGSDPASEEDITFVISTAGFAACETCVYNGQDLVPWNYLDYFIESDKMFVFYKDGNSVVYIPKKAFSKKHIDGIADVISVKLEQK